MSKVLRLLFVPVLLLSAISAAAASERSVRIHRYSAFNAVLPADHPENKRARTQVNVYGQRLTLSLESNTQLLEQLPKAGKPIAVLRGNLEGKAGSWVRMTQTSGGTHGLIWDGAELYVVEPGSAVGSALAVALPQPDSASVIFKLSDTTLDLGGEYCGSSHGGDNTGLATYQALATELSEQVGAGGRATLRLEMQILTDAAFSAQYSSNQNALEAIMIRLNNVDGIFTSQVGLEVQAIDVKINDADVAGLSASTDANTLLNSLGQLRSNNPVMGSYALTHLFTGRDLDGDTLGIAYIGNICGTRYGVSLSEIRSRGAWIDSLVTAHELGHQLGAVHDGSGVCGGTAAQSYLMGEQINGSSELSQCSRDTILAIMQRAACLVPVGASDISLGDAVPPQAVADASFQWSLPIRNLGTGAADQPTVQLTLPVGLIAENSAIAGGSCIASNNSAGGTVDCVFDTLAANETRLLELGMRAVKVGSYQVSAAVGAASDNNPLNNSAVYSLSIATANAAPVDTSNASAPPASTVSEGGGGSFNALALLALATLTGWRRLTQYAK